MPITSSFHPFSRLPLELRLRIWSFALPAPQLASLVAYTEEESLRKTPFDNPGGPQKWIYMYFERCSTLSVKKPHPLLQANHESRSLVLSHHHLLPYTPDSEVLLLTKTNETVPSPRNNGPHLLEPRKLLALNKDLIDSQTKPFTLFNPHQDVLFLADPRRQIHCSSLSVVVRWLHPPLLSSIRILGLSYYTWRKDRKFKILNLLYEFSSLEKLYVCFVGSGEEWDGGENGGWGGGWLDAVRREGDDMDGSK
ncbi:uncharacterized protein LY89DRAFT_16914 [Mollisia scopiformis]|uniref:2EXR domain-containing protein n=1 Tax=Mollisia scopiformis TaxID=149040 RepID=A0A194XVC5_MOLSC|nr:uncharacterized protein LY89DRAFT_16914 [Mollisia scopiformis]KUJ24280.1 hypothetical protein LY89DRAFT_16914 [Mollisia scopiformis]